MRGRVNAIRTFKGLVEDLRITLCLVLDVCIIDLDKNVDKMSCHLPLK